MQLNKQIADDLGICQRTVKLHRTSITTKLGVRSVAELARLAHEAGTFPQRHTTDQSSLNDKAASRTK